MLCGIVKYFHENVYNSFKEERACCFVYTILACNVYLCFYSKCLLALAAMG